MAPVERAVDGDRGGPVEVPGAAVPVEGVAGVGRVELADVQGGKLARRVESALTCAKFCFCLNFCLWL